MLQPAQKLPDGHHLTTDICIVGGGAAGLVLATELARTGRQILVIEAGTAKGEAGSQPLYQGETADPDFHLPPDLDRTRGLGGSSSMWGGRCMPYDPIDFEARDYIENSGWPFDRDHLMPFYLRAQEYADCGAFDYSASGSGLPGHLIKGFQSQDLVTDSLERWSPPAHFGKTLGPDLIARKNVTLLTGAVATQIDTQDTGTVSGLRVQSVRNGRNLTVAAAKVILTGGGMETTRLLLNSPGPQGQALGDHSGWLGRGYMSHVSGVISRIRFNEGQEIVFGYEQDADDVYVRRRMTLSAGAQRTHRVPNTYFLLDRPLLEDADHNSAILSLAFLAKRLFQRQSKDDHLPEGKFALYKRHIRNLIFGAPEVLTVLPKFGRKRFLKGRRLPSLLLNSKDNSFYLYFHAEQSAAKASHLKLSDQKDALGMPKMRVEAELSENDAQGVVRGHTAIRTALEAGNVGTLEFLGDDPLALVKDSKSTLGHHIGSARMAADPAQGVVDPDGRVHGISNLYLASSATFPTSSQAHPTLTILAMAVRLADHLATQDAGGAPVS